MKMKSLRIMFLVMALTLASQAFGQDGVRENQVQEQAESNDFHARKALEELYSLRSSFGHTFSSSFMLGHMAYEASNKSGYGALFTAAALQQQLCIASAIDFGLLLSVGKLHLDDTALFMTGLSEETASELRLMCTQVAQVTKAAERLVQSCGNSEQKLTQAQIVAYLKDIHEIYTSILNLSSTLDTKLRAYVIPK